MKSQVIRDLADPESKEMAKEIRIRDSIINENKKKKQKLKRLLTILNDIRHMNGQQKYDQFDVENFAIEEELCTQTLQDNTKDHSQTEIIPIQVDDQEEAEGESSEMSPKNQLAAKTQSKMFYNDVWNRLYSEGSIKLAQPQDSKISTNTFKTSTWIREGIKPSENMSGVTSLVKLQNRFEVLKQRCSNSEWNDMTKRGGIKGKINFEQYQRDCLRNMKLTQEQQIKYLKTKVSKLMMEHEQAQKIDEDVKRAEFKGEACELKRNNEEDNQKPDQFSVFGFSKDKNPPKPCLPEKFYKIQRSRDKMIQKQKLIALQRLQNQNMKIEERIINLIQSTQVIPKPSFFEDEEVTKNSNERELHDQAQKVIIMLDLLK